MGVAEAVIDVPRELRSAGQAGAGKLLNQLAAHDGDFGVMVRQLRKDDWKLSLDGDGRRTLVARREFASAGDVEAALRRARVPHGSGLTWTATLDRSRQRDALLLNTFPGAHDVFLGALLGHLQRTGAKTVRSMNVHWFYKKLNEAEKRRVVEAARVRGLIEPVAHEQDAYGDPIEDVEWAPTEKGFATKKARGLGPNDVREYLLDALRAGFASKEFIATAVTVAAFVVGSASEKLDLTGDLRVLVIGLAVLALLLLVVYRGIREDRKLQQAARAWPRLHPSYRLWQSNRWRMRLEAVAWTLLIAAYGVLALDRDDLWEVALGLAIIAALIGGTLSAWRRRVWRNANVRPRENKEKPQDWFRAHPRRWKRKPERNRSRQAQRLRGA